MKIFFDMDGTLCEFLKVGPDVWSKPGYSRKLPPLRNMVDAVRLLIASGEKPEIYICSAAVSMDFAVEDKKYWLKQNKIDIPEENMLFVPYGCSKKEAIEKFMEEKGKKIEGGDLFIDDYTANLIDVGRISAITPIKILNGINDTNRTFKGMRISAFSSAVDIAMMLLGVSQFLSKVA